MAFKINTHTQTLTPLNAWITIGKSAKLLKNAAIRVIITTDGVTTPKVAITPPIKPAILYPIKVATFTAITPGVHWPIA